MKMAYRVETADQAKTAWRTLAEGVPTKAQAERIARGLLEQGYGAVARITKCSEDVRYYDCYQPAPFTWAGDLPVEAFEGGVTVVVPVEEVVRDIWATR